MKIEIKKILIEEGVVNYSQQLLQEGAYSLSNLAATKAFKKAAAAARLTFKNTPFQYFLNPFVDGPFRHFSKEITSGILEIIYKIFKDKGDENIQSIAELSKELGKVKSPFDREIKITIDYLKEKNKNRETVKNKYFMQWLLNPFVSYGPIRDYIEKRTMDKITKLFK